MIDRDKYRLVNHDKPIFIDGHDKDPLSAQSTQVKQIVFINNVFAPRIYEVSGCIFVVLKHAGCVGKCGLR
jgi:hypothetical protein